MYNPGEVVFVDFGDRDGVTEKGVRPAVIVSSELHNQINRSLVVVPLTKQLNKSHWHEHAQVQILSKTKHYAPSVAMCEHVTEVDRDFVDNTIGYLSESDYRLVLKILKEVTLCHVS